MLDDNYPPYPRLDEKLHRHLCEVLLEIRTRFPDHRFGQLIAHLAFSAGSDSYGVEDWELLFEAQRFLERTKDRVPDVGPLATPTASPSPDAA